MKNIKRILLLITMITLSLSLFGKSGSETAKSDDGKAELAVSAENRYGKIVYKFHNLDQDEAVKYVIVKVGDTLYDQDGNVIYDNVELKQKLTSITTTETKTITINDEESTTSKGTVEVDSALFAEFNSNGDVEVSVDTSLNKVKLTVWTITQSGKVYNIDTNVSPNFFSGEEEFFNSFFGDDSTLTYEQQIIFFLSTFFITENEDAGGNVTGITETAERSNFIDNATALFSDINSSSIPSVSDYITAENFNDKYYELLKHQNKFKAAFASHFILGKESVISKLSEEFSNRTAKLPFLDINEKSFDSIYGNKNPYIAIYLNYIATEVENGKSSKPVLSYLINKKVNENNTDEIKYNYNQYRQVTEQEGIDIAESALKYMTWALEYTPGVRSEDENNKSDYKVYATNSVEVKEWVNGALLNVSNRSNNYFNGEVKIFNRPSVVEENSPLGKIYDKNLITSPYSNSQGNPIAYSAMGIDTPKTFNYKLYKQNLARRWLMEKYIGDVYTLDNYPAFANGTFSTTMATSSYYDSYVDEIDLYREAGITLKKDAGAGKYETALPSIDSTFYEIEPYLPGVRSETEQLYSTDQNSLYHPNKSAGVDSLGLLMGSLTMTNIAGDYLNVFNTKIDEELDANYIQKNPSYHVLDINDQLKKPYRFTKADLERSTILLPDLSMARPGDILVNYTNKEPMIGVIISADFTGLDSNSTVEDYMKKILVVSINSGFRMANVGVWLSEEGVYGGFAKPGEEKKYHLRRMLVKPTTSGDNISYVNDNFEFFDTELIELDVEVDYKSVNGDEINLIPNTGELLIIEKIEIKGNYGDDPEKLKEEDRNVTILPPLDPYNTNMRGTFTNDSEKLAAITADKSNIYRNKGKGYKFYATDGVNHILLATFTLKGNITNHEEGKSPYDIEYNQDIFKNSLGQVKDGFKLAVESNQLKFTVYGETNTLYNQFSIRPINEKVRAGDDLQLRFALQNNYEISGKTKVHDYISLYDKKMIWRANLYINEGKGEADWNNNFPWNAPPVKEDAEEVMGEYKVGEDVKTRFLTSTQVMDTEESIWYGPNEWNRVYDFEKLVNEFHDKQDDFDITNISTDDNKLEQGNGTQSVISINSSTWSINHSAGVNQANKVAYDWIGMDGPFEFNFKTDNQRKLLNYYFKENGDYVAGGTSNLQEVTLTWDSTTAPEELYANYIHSSTKYTLSTLSEADEEGNYPLTLDSIIKSITGEQKTISGKDYYAYLPSLSNNVSDQMGGGAWPKDISAGYTAGTDCIGFVKNSASYLGNKYGEGTHIWGNIIPATWGESRIDTYYPYYDRSSYLIKKKGEKVRIGIDDEGIPILEYDFSDIKVGDLLYYCNKSKEATPTEPAVPASDGTYGGMHVMMIYEIANDGDSINESDIKLIESTDWNTYGYVRKEKTLNDGGLL
ncbi:hypothetical protein EW093_05600 [Thiospirochaeta perfilievii]|uniref:Uncharacterized protein n=1 Tax=Thiospirochaeta perfilievii TaxID=252967 RepID=A0A5C1QAW8_9SPIO|nr:hypothetical protein [Thiospirochaeta perfilievii]QEN04200.1 hypothetical protein EW093_05600 [Thiospirochaeta perfilievii]